MSSIEDFLHSFASNDAFKAFNYFMQEPAFIILIAFFALGIIWLKRDKYSRLSVVISLLVTLILVTVLKQLYGDPRPCVGLPGCEPDFGFPSGHAALSFSLAMNLFGVSSFYFAILLAVLIALSRVISGAHTFAQIAGGMILGVLVSTTIAVILQKLREKNEEKNDKIRVFKK